MGILRPSFVWKECTTPLKQYHTIIHTTPPKLLCKAQCRVRVASSFNRVSSHNKNKSKRFAKKRVRLCMPKRKFSRFHKRPWPVRLKGKQIAARHTIRPCVQGLLARSSSRFHLNFCGRPSLTADNRCYSSV